MGTLCECSVWMRMKFVSTLCGCSVWIFFFFFFFFDNQLHIQKIVFFQLRNDSHIYKKFNLYNKW